MWQPSEGGSAPGHGDTLWSRPVMSLTDVLLSVHGPGCNGTGSGLVCEMFSPECTGSGLA